MTDFAPSRQQSDLADVVEMLLDKGVVINADIAVSVGDTQLLGIQVRAAIASFDTAARYGLEFPEGTDMRRMAEEVGDPEIAEMDRPRVPIDPTRSVNVTAANDHLESDREDEGGSGSGESGGGGGEAARASDEAVDGSGDSGLLGDDDRGTERLGARPDPESPTDDGFNVTGDDGDGLLEEAADAVTGDDETGSGGNESGDGEDGDQEASEDVDEGGGEA